MILFVKREVRQYHLTLPIYERNGTVVTVKMPKKAVSS